VLEGLGQFLVMLPGVAYVVLLVVVIRRGVWARHVPRVVLLIDCALIMRLPFMDRPYVYITAVAVALSRLVWSWSASKAQTSSTLREE
jgi:hypothetical protein